MTITRREEPTRTITIYIAGDAAEARRVCRRYCLGVGLCVTVSDCDYVYTGGSEAGVAVGLLNYPRFPSTPEELFAKAEGLAMALLDGLCQHSVLICADDKTVWITSREVVQW